MALPVVRLRYSPCCALSIAEPFAGYAGTCLNGTCHSGSVLDTAEVTHHSLLSRSRGDCSPLRVGMVCAKFTDLDPDHHSGGFIGPCRTLGSHRYARFVVISSIELICTSIQSVVVAVVVRRRQPEGVSFCTPSVHTIALMIVSNPSLDFTKEFSWHRCYS